MKFKKIKFNSKDKTLELSLEYGSQSSNEIVNKCGQIVHEDFIDAINSLKYHFAYLCDLREVDQIDERKEAIEKLCEHTALKEVAVQSVVFSSNVDDDSVMLCGHKRFNSKFINMNTPLTPLTADEYVHYWELTRALDTLQEEARLYLQEGKWGVTQTSLDFGMASEFEDAEQAAYEEHVKSEIAAAPAKRGRKPKIQEASQHLAS